ncbi:MAG: Rid family detoxifying hydrolase, partial [Bacteroidota bacterium]
APPPAGHYSQAMIHNDVVYVAGQLPITPEGKKLITASLADQTMQVLQNLEAILKAAGSSPQHTLSVTIYITDVANWGTVNEVYTRFFGDHKPARAIVPIKELHYGLQIEVQAIAAVIG